MRRIASVLAMGISFALQMVAFPKLQSVIAMIGTVALVLQAVLPVSFKED